MSEIKKLSPTSVKRMKEETLCAKLYENFGIEADPESFSHEQLEELYLKAQESHFADSDEDGNDDDVSDEEKTDADGTTTKDRESIGINIAHEKGEPAYVDLSLNGKAWRIKRGEDVEVPRYVYVMLKGLVETHFEHDDKTGENIPRDQPRFNITVNI